MFMSVSYQIKKFELMVTVYCITIRIVELDSFQSPAQQEHTDQARRRIVRSVLMASSVVKERSLVHHGALGMRPVCKTLVVVCI